MDHFIVGIGWMFMAILAMMIAAGVCEVLYGAIQTVRGRTEE